MFLRGCHLAPVLALLVSGCGRIGYDGIAASGGLRDATAAGSGGAAIEGGASGTKGSGGATSGGGAGGAATSGGTVGSGGTIVNDATAGGGGTIGNDAAPGSGGAVNTGGLGPIDAGNMTRIVDVLDPTQTVRSGAAQIGKR